MMRIISGIVDFISRNPLTTIILVLVIMAAPWLIGAFAIVILTFILIGAISLLSLMWKVRKAQGKSPFFGNRFRPGEQKHEGDVTIHGSAHEDKRVKDSVGEYVDFKEIRKQ